VTRPDYIARGGDLVMAPPLELLGTTMYSFLVGADLDALTRMIDAQLNAVTAASGTVYKPLLPMAAIVCANITKSYSTTPPDSQKGWMSERDFGVWIPVVAGTTSGGTWKPGRIAWYLPYVFVDNVAAMVTGREVFGFFKQTATLDMPAGPSASGTFSVDALAIRTFSTSSEAERVRLMELASSKGAVAPAGAWTGVRDAADALWHELERLFFAGARGLAVGAWDVMKNLLEDLVSGDVPMVFLKQFRDAGEAAKACYQAVIEAPAHLQKFYGGWFTHPHDITITPCDSHPIVSDCGLAGASIHSQLGFWCEIDFIMQPGRVVAESS
jgi:hypothetical protein